MADRHGGNVEEKLRVVRAGLGKRKSFHQATCEAEGGAWGLGKGEFQPCMDISRGWPVGT